MRKLLASVAIAAATAGTAITEGGKPTVMLVHGTFADTSSWNRAVEIQLQGGYPVVAMSNPMRGLQSDADCVSDTVASIKSPVVLVDLSYGGAVISATAKAESNVKAPVFGAGFAPDSGETAASLTGKFPSITLRPNLAPPVPLTGGGNDLYIQQDKFHDQIAADVPKAETLLMFITGRKRARLDEAVAAIGPSATEIRAESANLADIDRLFAQVKKDAGRIDVLFANAGSECFASFGTITEEQLDDSFVRNVTGALFTDQKALPLLAAGASVIVTGSPGSIVGTPAFSVYGAPKAAVRSFARHWTMTLKERGIRVNSRSPGPTETPGLVAMVGDDAAMQQALLTEAASGVPLDQVANPDEIANAVLFLASDQSSFVTGIELFVDGGIAQV